MESKKKSHSDLEKKRLTFFQIGLIFSLICTLIAFEWRSYYNPYLDRTPVGESFNDDYEILPPIFIPAPPKLPQPKMAINLNPVIDTEIYTDSPDSELTTDEGDPDINIESLPERYDIEESVLLQAEVMPEYPGGLKSLYAYLERNLKYPNEAKKTKKEEIIYVTFVIDREGNVRIEEVHGQEQAFKDEAQRVISKMPKWKPGKQGGRTVEVRQTIPIKFKLARF
jgi:periplasmic protein TonB